MLTFIFTGTTLNGILKKWYKFFCFLAGLGEFRIRDLNDEINKLLREKGHWEVRIKELGGPDYVVSKQQPQWLLAVSL